MFPLHLEKLPPRICSVAGAKQSPPVADFDITGTDGDTNVGDLAFTDELKKQFALDLIYVCSPLKRAAQDPKTSFSKSVDEIKSYIDKCDVAPSKCSALRDMGGLDLLNAEEAYHARSISSKSSASKRRILREVEGRLQYVGFPADLKCPECKRPRPVSKQLEALISDCGNFLNGFQLRDRTLLYHFFGPWDPSGESLRHRPKIEFPSARTVQNFTKPTQPFYFE